MVVAAQVVSALQQERVERYIGIGNETDAARLVYQGARPDRPDLAGGFFVPPVIFADVRNDMTIAREEVFGPVLTIIGYEDDAEAVAIANDTEYGLSGYVSGEPAHAQQIALQIRTGMVHINGAPLDISAPFGGYKKSGNGREWGLEGFEEYLETKAMMGAA